LGVHFRFQTATEEELQEQMDYMKSLPYSSAVGSVMYAMIGTRPDYPYPVGVISRYMSKPLRSHWQAVKWVLRYIKGTHTRCEVNLQEE
jgi:ATP-binding cassette subfamily B (MDR/TAP) protein 1